jgi:uncharacterized membrane protein HdeD (DUF308 family)
VTSPKEVSDKKARKWLWYVLIALAAVQVYYVQEMLAALILFAIFFGVALVVVGVLFALDLAGQRAAEWAEPQAVKTAHVVAQKWTVMGDFRKKLLHHQHSETAQ